jgi:hypothetical protein
MIEKELQIKELYEFRHFHDDFGNNKPLDYENKLLPLIMTDSMFKNNKTRIFLEKLQKLFIWNLESILVLRNFWNYTVGKYYNKHIN